MKLIGAMFVLAAVFMEAGYGQTMVDLRSQAKSVDFSNASSTKPSKMGVALPVVCALGETFFLTTAPAGKNLYGCTSVNSWSQMSGAAVAHTHSLSDVLGITGKQGPAGTLQAFGGGTVTANDCARFDAAGNIVSAGAPCGTGSGETTATSLQGNSLDTGTFNSAGQFYGWDPTADKLTLFTPGPLLSITGRTINVATESVPQYGASASLPVLCSQYGQFHFLTTGAPGTKLYYCNGSTYEPVAAGEGGVGLLDPGFSGILKRTTFSTTAIASPGTDYYAPGFAIAANDLPDPTTTTGGKVRAKSCGTGLFVNSINADSTVECAAPEGVQTAQGNTYTAGAKQVFQPSATTAGAQIACGPLPSGPAVGDLACDSAESNKLKQWNGSIWTGFNSGTGGSGEAGLADPGSNGILVRTGFNTTAARTISAGSSNIIVTGGDGSSNPVIDLGTTVDLTNKTTLPVQVGLAGNLPANCTVGQLYLASDAPAGSKLRTCSASNTWTAGQSRTCELHIWGSGINQTLQDSDDEAASCFNASGMTETITSVRCRADAGSPTVTPVITSGAADSILTAALTCGTATWASAALNGTPALPDGGTIDANLTVAGGSATNIRLVVTLTR